MASVGCSESFRRGGDRGFTLGLLSNYCYRNCKKLRSYVESYVERRFPSDTQSLTGEQLQCGPEC